MSSQAPLSHTGERRLHAPAGERIDTLEVRRDAHIAWIGSLVWIGADTLYFVAWLFAFFYLRALNNSNGWLPAGVQPPALPAGGSVLALLLVSAGVYFVATRSAEPAGHRFRILTIVALGLGAAACLALALELGHLGFSAGSGGYAGVFIGLTGSWLVHLVVAMGWLATIVTQAYEGGDSHRRPHAAAAFGRYLYFLAGVGIVIFVLLYLL